MTRVEYRKAWRAARIAMRRPQHIAYLRRWWPGWCRCLIAADLERIKVMQGMVAA